MRALLKSFPTKGTSTETHVDTQENFQGLEFGTDKTSFSSRLEFI
jgi:hypothetical protein